MDKAKAAVSSIIGKAGHHDTTVHEKVAPHVQKETVHEQRREEQTVAKDREVHQDHYHTTVQPVHDKEVLPEQHHHNLAKTEHRVHDHRDHGDTQNRLHHESAQFKDEHTRVGAQQTHQTAKGEAVGEHVHHHVHETVQPVVHKQTIEPHVVHTTVPVHETHYNKPQHHSASTLPAVGINEFKQQGGVLGGRDQTHDRFDGEPDSKHHHQHGGANTTHTTGTHATGTHGTHDTHGTQGTHGKPSLMDKLNPKKDADGDGKAGFMK